LLSDTKKQFAQLLFPLKVFGESGHAWLQWLNDYETYWTSQQRGEVASEKKKLEQIFGDILNSYFVCHIELDREISVEKVCDIFTRINSTGIQLDIFDLMNALLRPKGINLKQEWRSNEARFALPDSD